MSTSPKRFRDAFDPIPPQWRPLRVFNVYRIAIALLFLGLPFAPHFRFLGDTAPSLFVWVSLFYILLALSSILASYYRHPPFTVQIHVLAFSDIVVITLLMYTSGGIGSGLGILLVVAVAGTSLLAPDRNALFFSSVAAIAVLVEEGYSQLTDTAAPHAYPQAGFLGITLFATTLLTRALARRARQSAALAERRGIDLANLTELNEYIVNCMSRGIVVVDENGGVRLMNKPGARLLGLAPGVRPDSLRDVSAPLHQQFTRWRQSPAVSWPAPGQEFSILEGLKVRLSPVGKRREDRGCIIYLEDADEINRHVQETKLASLGRLTASISHEIRNPLGAISHAAQLLGESDDLTPTDQRLVGIINDNARRTNEVIRNVLQLSRKTPANRETFHLGPWLTEFATTFARTRDLPPDWARVITDAVDDGIAFDSGHLHQILWNLSSNAVQYGSAAEPATSGITLRVHFCDTGAGVLCLDVSDQGPGVPRELRSQVFEPFFTTSSRGTGLGLYISRQLCQDNGGDLTYFAGINGGSCFRIQFPRRQQEESSIAARAYR